MVKREAEKSSRSVWVLGAIAIVMGLVLGAVAVILLRPDDSATAVRLVRAEQAGDDPFTESVPAGAPPKIEQPAVEAARAVRADLSRDDTTSVLVASGTEPGLYGGSGDVHVCDANQLVAYLNDHADKANAFSEVLGITPQGIGDYVASLTPVVLLSDAVVTNHGFKDGHATSLTSVLQAGTAVMVDDQGVPRVKCNCGNPLTPPQVVSSADWNVDGDAWDGYDAAAVTGVVGGDAVTEFTVYDVVTGQPYTVPVGSSGSEGTAPDLDGDWTIELRAVGGLSALPSGELDPRICPNAGLDGAVLVVRGTQASIRGISGFGADLAGTVAPPPLAVPAGATGAEIRLHPEGATAPEVTIRLLSSTGSSLAGEMSMTGAQDPTVRVTTCDVGVIVRRGSASGPAPSSATSSTTTRAPAAGVELRGLDWGNRSYRLGADCPGPEVTLTNGSWEDPAEGFGVQIADVLYGDLTGDGGDEALVKLECYAIGGNAYPATPNVVFTSNASGPVQLGDAFEGSDAIIVGDAVQTTEHIWGPSDPRCCPSSSTTHLWRYQNGGWVS